MQEKREQFSSFSERISEIIEIEKVTANEFAKQLGYNRSQTVYDIVNGKSKPSADFFQRFINSGFSEKYSMEWVIVGKGLKDKVISYKEEVVNNIANENLPKYRQCPDCRNKERLIEQLQKENERLWKLVETKNGKDSGTLAS